MSKMEIGIIGIGVVGSAIRHGFERIGHDVSFFDLRHVETSIESVLGAEIVFVCVPTPELEDGRCDTRVVERTIADLGARRYTGVVAIKSTVPPGTTAALAARFQALNLAFCPEFLRERCAVADFCENHDVCVIGATNAVAISKIAKAHGSLPQTFVTMTPTEAELCKYFGNVLNALRVVFANGFYDVCQQHGADYQAVKSAMVKRKNIVDAYLDCNDNLRGFGGVCLPKDTAAFAHHVRSLGLPLKIFDAIVADNKTFRRTVLDGMREQAE